MAFIWAWLATPFSPTRMQYLHGNQCDSGGTAWSLEIMAVTKMYHVSWRLDVFSFFLIENFQNSYNDTINYSG